MLNNNQVESVLCEMKQLKNGDEYEPTQMSVWSDDAINEFCILYLDRLDGNHYKSMLMIALSRDHQSIFCVRPMLLNEMRKAMWYLIRDEHENLVERWMSENMSYTGLSDRQDAWELDYSERVKGIK